MSRRSSRRGTAPAFPALSEGIQNGLKRLVLDNSSVVAKMLDVDMVVQEDDGSTTSSDDVVERVLCEKCAQVMKQQQLSAASFLARFFHSDILSEHAILLGKSGKGSAATLADRIAAAWAQNKALPEKSAEAQEKFQDQNVAKDGETRQEEPGTNDEERKRKTKKEEDESHGEKRIPKKVKSSK